MRRVSRRAFAAAWACGVAAGAASCAAPATVFNTTWRNPAAAPVALAGQKVVALVVIVDEPQRRRAEDALAREITARGAQGVAAWTLLPGADVPDEGKARAALAASGAVGVVTMQVVGRQDLDDQRVEVGSAGYRSFWGNYRWSSRVAFSPGRSHGPQVWVETLVHSLAPEALLWSGRSRTADPGEAAALFTEVGRATAAEMERTGLLAAAPR
jgi:hypothetical protein